MRGRCSPKKSVAESSPRVRAPVLSKIDLRWSLTVCGEIASRCAAWMAVAPLQRQLRHLLLARGEPVGLEQQRGDERRVGALDEDGDLARARGAEQPAVEDEPGARGRLHRRAGQRRVPARRRLASDRGPRRARDGVDRGRAQTGLDGASRQLREQRLGRREDARIRSPEASSSTTPGASGRSVDGLACLGDEPAADGAREQRGRAGEQLDVALLELGLAGAANEDQRSPGAAVGDERAAQLRAESRRG